MNFIFLDDFFRDLYISIGVGGPEITSQLVLVAQKYNPIHHKNNVHCRWTKTA